MQDHRVRWPLTPLPGVSRELLLKNLQQVYNGLVNARGWTPARGAQRAYLDWANTAIELLNTLIGPADLERLVMTRRYWTMQSSLLEAELINHLVNVELAERVRVLDQVSLELRELIGRWSQPGIFAVADTSFYINGPNKLDEVDLAEIVSSHTLPIHLIVPILVMDELDRLKRSSDRGRASVTLAIFEDRIGNAARPGVLYPAENRTGEPIRGEATLEILFDPLGHTRLPINDDEIVDRAVSVQSLAGRPVRFVTCDTGQAFRARFAGLETVKIPPHTP